MSNLFWLRKRRWRAFARIMVGLAAEGTDLKTIMIDASYLKAHRMGAAFLLLHPFPHLPLGNLMLRLSHRP